MPIMNPAIPPSPFKNDRIILALIIGLACFLRFYKLAFQSFWFDELHTAIEADPALGWKELYFYLKCCDLHPPLFFVLEKILFLLFGHTEFVARALSAVAGTAGVWAIYLLGKEIFSVRLGLVAATFTCFNYFHILYSQEARPYSLAFLFATLSFLYFIRLLKNPERKISMLYALFTLLMLGTHYYGLFALASQIVIASVIWFRQRENRKLFFKHYGVSGFLIFLCYAPWLPVMFSNATRKSFWIPPISPGFAVDFFLEYFGDSDLLKPFLLLFLVSALLHVFIKSEVQNKNIQKDKYAFALLVCFLWIGITFLIPYLRSVLVVPMLYPRYTIVLLPAFIILLAMGVELISNNILKYTFLIFFCGLSLTDLLLVKNYYSEIRNTQFRELAAFIASDTTATYPVVSEVSAWHQQYYLKRFGYHAPIFEGKREALMDSILSKRSSKCEVTGFWISDGHGAQKPSPELKKKINASYFLVKEQDFKDAFAQLYILGDTTRDLVQRCANKSGSSGFSVGKERSSPPQ